MRLRVIIALTLAGIACTGTPPVQESIAAVSWACEMPLRTDDAKRLSRVALARAEALLAAKQRPSALVCLQSITLHNPEMIHAWALRADTEMRLGMVEQAGRSLRSALEQCKEDCSTIEERYSDWLLAQHNWLALYDWASEHDDLPSSPYRQALAQLSIDGSSQRLRAWAEKQQSIGRDIPAGVAAHLANRKLNRVQVSSAENLRFESVAVSRDRANTVSIEPSMVTTVDGKRVFVSWIESGTTAPGSVIRAALSDDFGRTWDASALPSSDEVQYQFDPMTAVDPASGDIVAGALGVTIEAGSNDRNAEMYYYRLPSNERVASGPSVGLTSTDILDKGWMTFMDGRFVTALGLSPVDTTLQESFDGGINWQPPAALPMQFAAPHVRGRNGQLYIGGIEVDGLEFRVRVMRISADSEVAVDPPVALLTSPSSRGFTFNGLLRVPLFAQIGLGPDDEIFVVWTDSSLNSDSFEAYQVYFARSLDDGRSWSEPMVLTGHNGGVQLMPWLEVDSDGDLHLAYLDTRHTRPEDDGVRVALDVYYMTSSDNGDSWSETRLTPVSLPSDDAVFADGAHIVGDYIGIAVGASDVYVSYPGIAERDNQVDNYVARRRLGLNVDGLWFNAEQSGHGLSIEHIENTDGEQILASWFTYDQGEPIWILAQGRLNGTRAVLTAYIDETQSGQFPPDFAAEQANLTVWGELVIDFASAGEAMLSWQSDGRFAEGSLSLERLVTVSDQPRGCRSGAWFDPFNPGHGLFVEIVEQTDGPIVVATWYAHHQGRQTWLQGIGPLVGDEATLSFDLLSGGDRPQDFSAPAISRTAWGEIDIQWLSEDSARLSWRPELADFPAGQIDLQRLTNLRRCDAQFGGTLTQ